MTETALRAVLSIERRLGADRGKTFGDLINAELARLIALGHLERCTYDISALAAQVNISRQSVSRRVDRLRNLGMVTAKHVRNRVEVSPTDILMRIVEEEWCKLRPVLVGAIGGQA